MAKRRRSCLTSGVSAGIRDRGRLERHCADHNSAAIVWFGCGTGAGFCDSVIGPRHRHLNVHRRRSSWSRRHVVVGPVAQATPVRHRISSAPHKVRPHRSSSSCAHASSALAHSRWFCPLHQCCCCLDPGLNYGVDFTGGGIVEATAPSGMRIADVRDSLGRADGTRIRFCNKMGDTSTIVVPHPAAA